MLVEGLRIDHYRHAALAGLTLVLMPQQVFIGDDVRPMVTTRVVYAQQDLTESCQPRQCFQGLGRQRRNPENDHSRGQSPGGDFEVIDTFDKALMDTGTALRHAFFSHIQQECAP
ncbi:hypothetical protein D3C81_1160000 [compost metagenome]